MLIANKIKLYPNKQQSEQIDKTIGCCRFLFNQMLAERIEKYKMKDENKLRTEKEYKEFYPFLSDASSRGLQQSRIDLDTAYKNFFRNVKKGKKHGFPKFKSKHTAKLSYREPQINGCIKISGNRITLLKLGGVKFKGKVNGVIKNVTIEKTKTGDYTASVLVELNNTVNSNRKGVVGIDLGIKELAITSDGTIYKHIDKLLERKIKKIQKHLARKIKGSKTKKKSLLRLNKVNTKQNNQLKHFHYHTIKDIIGENQTVVVEDLNIKGMMKNRCLSGAFQKKSLGLFKTRLLQKCDMLGVKVIVANRFFASSKLCSNCGRNNKELKLSDRTYNCSCGLYIDRDFNASLNLRALSGEYSDHRSGESVRLVFKSFDFSTSSFLGSSYL